MLSFRMILFAGAAGLCLWGLFNLLDNLKQPELLRSAKVVVVKGCEPAESDEARTLCPQLYCQKALLEAKAVPLASRFTVTVDEMAVPSGPHVIAGHAHQGAQPEGARQGFACVMRRNQVVASRLVNSTELAGIATHPADWQP